MGDILNTLSGYLWAVWLGGVEGMEDFHILLLYGFKFIDGTTYLCNF